jgi:hypothetical protein
MSIVKCSNHVPNSGGEIEVQFWLVRGLLFRIEYRSPQKVYYPPEGYLVESLKVWPNPQLPEKN